MPAAPAGCACRAAEGAGLCGMSGKSAWGGEGRRRADTSSSSELCVRVRGAGMGSRTIHRARRAAPGCDPRLRLATRAPRAFQAAGASVGGCFAGPARLSSAESEIALERKARSPPADPEGGPGHPRPCQCGRPPQVRRAPASAEATRGAEDGRHGRMPRDSDGARGAALGRWLCCSVQRSCGRCCVSVTPASRRGGCAAVAVISADRLDDRRRPPPPGRRRHRLPLVTHGRQAPASS